MAVIQPEWKPELGSVGAASLPEKWHLCRRNGCEGEGPEAEEGDWVLA